MWWENGYKGTYKIGEWNGAVLLVDGSLKLMETRVMLFETALVYHIIYQIHIQNSNS